MRARRTELCERDITHVERERSTDGIERFYWRLTAGNGRVLGRSPAIFTDRVAASEACSALARHLDQLVVTVEHAGAASGWRWRIDDARVRDGVSRTVSLSARTFERHGSCARAGQRMLDALAALSQRPADDRPHPV